MATRPTWLSLSPDPVHYTSTAVLAILRGSVCQKTIYQPDGAVKKRAQNTQCGLMTGNRYKSSVAVKRALEDRQSEEESDDGTVTETGGETSEFEPSPVKHPRIESVV